MVLVRKLPDALGQILVGIPISGDGLPQTGQYGKRVGIVDFAQPGHGHMAKFKTEKPSTRFEDAIGFGQRQFNAGYISKPEGDAVGVVAHVGERQVLGVAGDPLKALQISLVNESVTALLQHRLIDVADGYVPSVLGATFEIHAFGLAQSDITGATGHVDNAPSRLRGHPIDHGIFPQAMNAGAHKIIHDIVTRRYGIKDGAHPSRFCRGWHGLKAKMGRCFSELLGGPGHGRQLRRWVHPEPYLWKTHPNVAKRSFVSYLRQTGSRQRARRWRNLRPMPELPEVETTCRGLAGVFEGRRLSQVEVRRPDLRIPFPKGLAKSLKGRRIDRVARKAKYICLHLDDGQVALAHLGMSGRMSITTRSTSPGLHDHVVFDTDDGTRVLFNDPRRFGLLTLTTEDKLDQHRLLARMGPDPLEEAFLPGVLSAALKGKGTTIKAALLDQRVVAGLGNIYVCEALFRSGISPRRKAGTVSGRRAARLVPVIKEVLTEAIAAGGSTLRDYAQPSGELGYFKFSWRVYAREGEPCSCDPDARDGIVVKRIVQSGRSTFFCSRCQR